MKSNDSSKIIFKNFSLWQKEFRLSYPPLLGQDVKKKGQRVTFKNLNKNSSLH